MPPALIRVLWAPVTAAVIIGCLAAYVSAAPGMSAAYRGFHHQVEQRDGHSVRWARAYSKIDIRDLAWRPLRLDLTLQSHRDAPPDGTRIVVSIDDVPVAHLLVGHAWQRHQVIVRVPGALLQSTSVQIQSETVTPEEWGIGLGDVHIRPMLAGWWVFGVWLGITGALLVFRYAATSHSPMWLTGAAIGLLVLVLVRTSWLSDDAYITFRTIDNWFQGYGLRYNIDERVQAYTHPFWLLLVALATRTTAAPIEAATFVLSWLFTVGTALLVVEKVAVSRSVGLLGLASLTFSKAFIDFSTSGLENPLTHLLLTVFFLIAWRSPAPPLTLLALVASLLTLTRPDATLLILPMLIHLGWIAGWRGTLRAVAIGGIPVVVWEGFSLLYYGFALPNTAYAKLPGGVPPGVLLLQGLTYLRDSLAVDPLTLGLTVVVAACCVLRDRRRSWAVAVGIGIYLSYVVWIGGDFMSGRFLSAPFLCAVLQFVRSSWLPGGALRTAAFAATVLLGLIPATPTVLTGPTFGQGPSEGYIATTGIADERAFYYPRTGLMASNRLPFRSHAETALGSVPAVGLARQVVVVGAIGLYGFGAGPEVHVLDQLGLADPLLARVRPRLKPLRIAHFDRRIPTGYEESLQTGQNRLRDPYLAMYYQKIHLVTRGPIWSVERFWALTELNLYGHGLPFLKRFYPS